MSEKLNNILELSIIHNVIIEIIPEISPIEVNVTIQVTHLKGLRAVRNLTKTEVEICDMDLLELRVRDCIAEIERRRRF